MIAKKCTEHHVVRAKRTSQCWSKCEAEWGPVPDVGPEVDW